MLWFNINERTIFMCCEDKVAFERSFKMLVSSINAGYGVQFNKKETLNNFSANPFPQEKGSMLLGSLNQLARINNSNISKMGSFTHISFTGNTTKNFNQFAFLAPENKAIGLSMYAMGGLGVVTHESGNNLAKHGADIRHFEAYHSFDNKEGLIKVLTQDEKGNPAFKNVETYYKLAEGEHFVVLDEPSNGKPNYKIIEDANIQGSIKKINDKLELEDVAYKIFKQAGTGEAGIPTQYFIHTNEMAKLAAAYGGGAYGAYNGGGDIGYAGISKAFDDALPKFNTPEHGNYNPANIWLHDRQAANVLVDMAERSSNGDEYFNGLKIDYRLHNPGRAYQGHYDNPIDFFRIVGSDADLKGLQKHPDFDFVKKMSAEINQARIEKKEISEVLTQEEMLKLEKIFEPVIGKFRDSLGTYNICEIPIQSKKINPVNTSVGTVSTNYGNEMKNPNMPEIAESLTDDLASIETKNIVNGSTPANMKTNEIGAFGRPGNGFSADEIRNGYTPFEVKLNAAGDDILNLDEIYNAKEKNTEWLTNTIARATSEGKEALAKLFFNAEQLNPQNEKVAPANVLGGLSEYKKGDILHISWGRPDPQKGLPTLFESFFHFIKREDITKEEKLKVKLLAGAGGPNPWDLEAPDWKKIQEIMKDISEVDGGAYKNNACYVNGFFANRLANACNGSDFTSVYEPCGITPLESFAAGNPVISNNTGGSPDFIKPATPGKPITDETGFLTKHAFLVKPEVLGGDPNLTGEALNDFRRKAIAGEVSDCMKDFSAVAKDEKQFKQMMKNVLLKKTDWDNNGEFNGGKSANQRYFDEVWGITEDFKELEVRNQAPLKNLKGKFADAVASAKEEIINSTNSVKKGLFSSKAGKIAVIGTAVAAVGAIVFSGKFKSLKKEPVVLACQVKNTQNTTAPVAPSVVAPVAPSATPMSEKTVSLFQQIKQNNQNSQQFVKQA